MKIKPYQTHRCCIIFAETWMLYHCEWFLAFCPIIGKYWTNTDKNQHVFTASFIITLGFSISVFPFFFFFQNVFLIFSSLEIIKFPCFHGSDWSDYPVSHGAVVAVGDLVLFRMKVDTIKLIGRSSQKN